MRRRSSSVSSNDTLGRQHAEVVPSVPYFRIRLPAKVEGALLDSARTQAFVEAPRGVASKHPCDCCVKPTRHGAPRPLGGELTAQSLSLGVAQQMDTWSATRRRTAAMAAASATSAKRIVGRIAIALLFAMSVGGLTPEFQLPSAVVAGASM